MTKLLRRRHFQIWLGLAFLMPVSLVVTWLVIPNSKPIQFLDAPDIQKLPLIAKAIDSKDHWVNIRTNLARSEWQLEWINKYALTVPSAVIYKKSQTARRIDDNQLIGRIEAKGSYLFRTDSSSLNEVFILYDFIHEAVIDSINFKNVEVKS